MPLNIRTESPLTAHAHELIAGSEAALREVYSADECFTFTADQLDDPKITFLVAYADKDPVGCVALVDYGSYGEVKRLYVTPKARGSEAARALMSTLEDISRKMGHPSIMLETGEKLVAAVRLYQKIGYFERGPFGEYADHPASLFMEKPL
jgi:putative acetyltransferase